MIVTIDRAWLLDLAQKSIPGDPDTVDFGTMAAAVARHTDKVMDTYVYTDVHHRAAALMHQLVRVPGLEYGNELFGAVVAASYLTASGVAVTATGKQAAELAARIRDGLDVRSVAEEIRGWIGA
ncbi:fic family toxin-antitoxin system, toxin component [Streptomyces sp. HPF1205]|uniref:fic family toxin-antitoxin system, toxin component n=1 Tax=Streptomyces sp. HPF1205 TaxID=2873262 RepID=UPI001CEC3C90|nr:fic family toxin-antitoxin system, toxin component [Streptomyces sp. HPF1205]